MVSPGWDFITCSSPWPQCQCWEMHTTWYMYRRRIWVDWPFSTSMTITSSRWWLLGYEMPLLSFRLLTMTLLVRCWIILFLSIRMAFWSFLKQTFLFIRSSWSSKQSSYFTIYLKTWIPSFQSLALWLKFFLMGHRWTLVLSLIGLTLILRWEITEISWFG